MFHCTRLLCWFGAASLMAPSAVSYAQSPVLGDLSLWLRADAGVTTEANGTNVTDWADQSGAGHDASQGSSSSRPQRIPNVLNGKPVLRFNGGNDFFALNGQVFTTQQFTIMSVVNDLRGDGDRSFREIISNWDFSNEGASVFFGTTDNDNSNNPIRARLTDDLGGGSDPLDNQTGRGDIVNPASHFIFSGIASVSDAQVYQNNNLLAAKGTALSNRNLTTSYVIGRQGSLGGEYWYGDIAEVLVYNHALSPAEFAQNVRYLQAKYFGIVPTYNVSGSVMLDGVPDVTAVKVPVGSLTVTLHSRTSSTVLTQTAALAPVPGSPMLAAYRLASIPTGSYDIFLKGAKQLQVLEDHVTVNGDTTIADVPTLPGGDADNSNTVNFDDFLVLLNAFGTVYDPMNTGNGYDPAADFNDDGVINFDDFLILLGNFGATGDT